MTRLLSGPEPGGIAIIDTRNTDSPRVLGVGRTERDARAAAGGREGRTARITMQAREAVLRGDRVVLVGGVVMVEEEVPCF